MPTGSAGGRILSADELTVAKVLQNFGNNNTLWVVSPDFPVLFDSFLSGFRCVQAAGGVVSNASGRMLMIFRSGRWDLPKGHREPGESWEQCAVREVSEECGLAADALACRNMLCETWHAYELRGEWVVKQCRWFAVDYNGDGQPVPQTEESITEARWVRPEDTGVLLATSYQTIKNVIKSYMNEK